MVVNQLKVHPFQSSGFRCVNLHPYSKGEEGAWRFRVLPGGAFKAAAELHKVPPGGEAAVTVRQMLWREDDDESASAPITFQKTLDRGRYRLRVYLAHGKTISAPSITYKPPAACGGGGESANNAWRPFVPRESLPCGVVNVDEEEDDDDGNLATMMADSLDEASTGEGASADDSFDVLFFAMRASADLTQIAKVGRCKLDTSLKATCFQNLNLIVHTVLST